MRRAGAWMRRVAWVRGTIHINAVGISIRLDPAAFLFGKTPKQVLCPSSQRLKTVELIVERIDWIPPTPKHAQDTLVALRIEANDLRMRAQAKAAGGRWSPEKRLWFVKYGNIAGTPLEKHIHVDDA